MSNDIDLRVGLDLCAAEEVAEAIATLGHRYLERIYTQHEIDTCTPEGTPDPERLAARFAAKEATVKALRPDGVGIDLRSIEIVTQPGGWSEITLTGAAAEVAAAAGIHTLNLSVTHERGMAAAVVVAQAHTSDTPSKGDIDVH